MLITYPSYTVNPLADTERFYREIYKDGVYKRGVCVDIGANVGLYSLFVSPFYEKIYAVEALPTNFKVLQGNIEANKITNVSCYNYAIGKRNEMRRVSTNRSDGGNAIHDEAMDYVMVQGKTLHTFFTEQHIDDVDLMKVDIECGEFEMVASDDFADASKHIRAIVGEHHNEGMVHRLEDLGFKVYAKSPYYFYARRV